MDTNTDVGATAAGEDLTTSGAILRQYAMAQDGRRFDDHLTRTIRGRRLINALFTASVTFVALLLSAVVLVWTLSML